MTFTDRSVMGKLESEKNESLFTLQFHVTVSMRAIWTKLWGVGMEAGPPWFSGVALDASSLHHSIGRRSRTQVWGLAERACWYCQSWCFSQTLVPFKNVTLFQTVFSYKNSLPNSYLLITLKNFWCWPLVEHGRICNKNKICFLHTNAFWEAATINSMLH